MEEIGFYMFSGQAQTEPFRRGQLHGPCALCQTRGPAPAEVPDMEWMGGLGLRDRVPASERGRARGSVAGTIRGTQ